jgi:hypothetical protein
MISFVIPAHKFCTYLISYKGNKFPPFYIGYTTIARIQNGYLGSVASKAYKNKWEKEVKQNPQLFKIKILTMHSTREEAISREIRFQQQLNILTKPTIYTNKAIGRHVNNKGRKRTPEHSARLSASNKGRVPWNKGLKIGKPSWNSGLTKDTSQILKQMGEQHSKIMKGRPCPKQSIIIKQKYVDGWAPRKGKWHSEETKEVIRLKKTGQKDTLGARRRKSISATAAWAERRGIC